MYNKDEWTDPFVFILKYKKKKGNVILSDAVIISDAVIFIRK